MRSKAAVKSHPIHPILVSFPVAFLTAAPVLDIVGLLRETPSLWTSGAYANAAAIFTGLAAGAAGLVDYLYVVPPNSSAKKRATWHMAINVTALALVAVAWAFRDLTTLKPQAAAVALEVAALALAGCGGWLGGTLVYRNQIGVDHRYARAGKWRETTITGSPGESIAIDGASELQIGQMMLLRLPDRRLVLARTDNGFVAFDDHCTHRGGSLAGGTLACGTVCCPWHGSQFAADSGAVVAGPAEKPIGTYRLTEAAGEVRLVMPHS